MSMTQVRGCLILAAAAFLLAGCGGGNYAGVGSGGTGAVAGTATGFGSVIVDGDRYDDSNASVTREDDPTSAVRIASTDIKLGQRVELRYSGTAAQTVTVGAEIVGVVSAIDTSVAPTTFTVAGQTVVESGIAGAPTVYEGATGFAQLAIGDVVEVHGNRDAATNVVTATRVERKAPNTVAYVRVVGPVSNLTSNATTHTFMIAGLTVDYGSATVLPANGSLANGQRVAVYSDTPLVSGSAMTAKVVRIKAAVFADGEHAHVGGLVSNFNSSALTFTVFGVPVDASSASFTNGDSTNLANGRLVRVKGTFTGGRLVATTVRFVILQNDEQVELIGAVTDFVSKASFRVRGVPVDASANTVTYAPSGTDSDNLGNGTIVRIHGNIVGDVVQASKVEYQTSATGWVFTLLGQVQNYSATAGTFNLQWLPSVTMRLSTSARFSNLDGTGAPTVADFANSRRVIVRGSLSGGVLVVTDVVFRNVLLPPVRLEGTISQVDTVNGQFRINGVLVSMPGGIVGTIMIQNLADGMSVDVQGTLDAQGNVVATQITLNSPLGVTVSRIVGYVSDFASIADFRVADQRIDASGSGVLPVNFHGNVAADVANGVYVEVRGLVNSVGVLIATDVYITSP